MGGPITERRVQSPVDLAQRIATRLERRNMFSELRQAARTLKEKNFSVIGVSAFSFNPVTDVDDAIMRAATGCIVASRRLEPGKNAVLDSHAFVPISEPNIENAEYVHAAIKELRPDFTPDSRYLSFVDIISNGLILGAVDLQTNEVYRYSVAPQRENS